MGDDLAGQQIMSFAAQLPVLERFRFVGEIERPLYLPGTNNFPTLKRLELIMQSEDSRMENTIMAGVVRAMNCIEELPLYTISISSGLLRDIRQHSRTLTMLRFQSCSVASDLKDIHLHQIFRSCYVLKSLVCTYLPASPNVTLACDPCIFDQQIWACSGLETLRVAPDCVLRGMGYDSLEAQAAFFQQLAMLPYLKELGFARGVGSRSFYLEETLHLLIQSVPNLEVLDVASTELENNANFKPDHAELICRGLPNLKALRGLYHIDCREFVNYIRQHRPEVDLAY
ncbi:hypothetical protein EDD11_002962 [Mortierella claussenii]|nr:hypothetical protein EDD11_002962 [Mortierella claussenii]